MPRARHASMGLAVALACALAAPPASADPDPDPWFGKDKALHFGASAVISSGGYAIGTLVFPARYEAMLLGGGVALAAGAGKELLDMTGFGDPSWRDFTWDVIGTAAGLAVAWGIDLLVRGADDRHPVLLAPAAGSHGAAMA